MNLPQPLRISFACLFIFVLSSCSGDFRKAWKRDICPAPPPANGVAGKWEGTWLSTANGHHGKLRCVVSGALETGKLYAKGDHEFFYQATWKSILSGSYKAVHNVQKKGDGHVFKGEHKMPDWAGGLYHYEGTIKGDDFNALYKSAMDRGTFTMKRVR
ncbi:hypothetical protein [Prosthecobacter sp.]|uniref:hypothetical protein n=1 Tax=Prosthecobacter sp. TaxID=1965333 RepID=UPI002AB90E02|nr:hypothetical protein [Prosthecobacter sp.]MDZ4403671.1 hypothetical protein [Prosthecobacter sp.]